MGTRKRGMCRPAKVSAVHSTPCSLRCCVWRSACTPGKRSETSECPRCGSESSSSSATHSRKSTLTRKTSSARMAKSGCHQSWCRGTSTPSTPRTAHVLCDKKLTECHLRNAWRLPMRSPAPESLCSGKPSNSTPTWGKGTVTNVSSGLSTSASSDHTTDVQDSQQTRTSTAWIVKPQPAWSKKPSEELSRSTRNKNTMQNKL